MKHTNDFDDVFKTLKLKHIRLFISVINETFGKNFPLDAHVDILAAEAYLTESETAKGDRKLEEKITDFLIRLGGETFLLECQSYDDGSMAIRLAEYAFIAARKTATWNVGTAHIPMPSFSVVYIRRTSQMPKKTRRKRSRRKAGERYGRHCNGNGIRKTDFKWNCHWRGKGHLLLC